MIINPKFRELQAMLLDYAGTRAPDSDRKAQARIDAVVKVISEIHTAAPHDATVQLRAAIASCKSSPYMGALLTMMIDELLPPAHKAPVGKPPIIKPTGKQNMGKPNMGAPTTHADTTYWWNNL